MSISANSLFHFTGSLKSLIGILSSHFKLTYCKEKYYLAKELYDSNYPMICFCDIPLYLAQNHIKNYGRYAIGMTKEWAISHNLNPVVYVEENSLLARDIVATIDDISKILDATKYQLDKLKIMSGKLVDDVKKATEGLPDGSVENSNAAVNKILENKDKVKHIVESLKGFNEFASNYPKMVKNTTSVFGYIKNYEGTLERRNKVKKNYRFYDEREWRFVPDLGLSNTKQLSEIEYKKYRGLGKEKPFINNISLPFTAQDIRYLLVKSSKDVPKLLRVIRNADNLTKNPNDADILATKILTVEQLQRDF